MRVGYFAAAAACAMAAPASAATITYRLTGVFEYIIDNQRYGDSSALVIGTGDTDTVTQIDSSLSVVQLDQIELRLNGQSYFTTEAGFRFFSDRQRGVAGFSDPDFFDIIDFSGGPILGWDAVSPLAPFYATTVLWNEIETDRGLVRLVAPNNLQFLASVAGSSVPEPATWSLMILGFAAAGSAMRRRQATVRGTLIPS